MRVISTVAVGIPRRSVHALAVLFCHYRAKQTWESDGTHFSMQMLQWEKCVCVCVGVTVTLIHTTPQSVFLRGPLQTQPQAVCVRSGHVYLCACVLQPASDLSLTGPAENERTHQTAHLSLNVHRFYPCNFPHGSGNTNTRR